MVNARRIIDISQPISSASACFPGDVAFRRDVTLTHEESKVVNLTAMTMSPHVGTHADSWSHVRGRLDANVEMAGQMPLDPFFGTACVVDMPTKGAIDVDKLKELWWEALHIPERVLFKTCSKINYEQWEPENYSYLTMELISYLHGRGVKLIGIDSPSVDHVESKTLTSHHYMIQCGMYWLENLDLTNVKEGTYTLAAFPLKLMETEASPVRAVLLEGIRD